MARQRENLVRSAPYFPVHQIEPTLSYYERVLGFACEYAGGSPVEFAIVSRDGLGIMLRRVDASVRLSPNEAQGGTWDVFFWVKDGQALFDELSAGGADVVYGPVLKAEYHMKEFAVRDRNGYVLGFGELVDASQ